MSAAAADAIVIGGGLMGLWSALRLARTGRRVRLLEAERIGRHASSASAGGVRSLNRDPAEIPLARAALPLWHEAAGELGADVGFRASSQLRVAEDEAALEALHERAALTRALGYTHEELIDAATLFARESALAPHCRGALLVRDDGFADPLKTVHALCAACRAESVEIVEETPVTALAGGGEGVIVETAAGVVRADVVVNAAGAWGHVVAATVGEIVPLTPTALQMSVTEPLPRFAHAVIGTAGHKLSLKQTEAGHVVIGGGFVGTITGRLSRPRAPRVGANLQHAVRLFPHLAQARVVRTWAGIEGVVADGLPVIGPSRLPGLVHAFGFSAHGFALSPLVARLVERIVAGRAAEVPLAPFAADRFVEIKERRHA